MDFDANCSTFENAPLSYAWDFGDGTNGSGAAVGHVFSAAGSYPVTLTIEDSGGATAATQRTVTVFDVAESFADDFERADGPIDGWTAYAIPGAWNLSGGTLATGPSAEERWIWAGDPPVFLPERMVLTFDMSFLAPGTDPLVGRHAGAVFCARTPTHRYAPDARGYTVFYIDRADDRGLTLDRWDHGALTPLNPPGGTPAIAEPPSTLRIEVEGPAIRVFADGALAIEAEDETYRDGLFGLWVWEANHVRFDNVLLGVDELPSCGGAAGTRFLRGDTNADGRHNIADAICLLGFLFGSEDDPCKQGIPRCRDTADANNDGKIDIADAIKILGYLFTSATTGPLPEPFTACGLDPAEPADSLDCAAYAPCAR